MGINRGTHEGDIQEIQFVKLFNQDKHNPMFSVFVDNIKENLDNVYIVRVTTNQFSLLSKKNTKTRSDCYAIYTEDSRIKDIIIENDFYLDEGNIRNINFSIIPRSGISIKIVDSEKYQIIKIGTNSFKTLFGNYELGAGASLFCSKDEELIKNRDLIRGWNTSEDEMKNYFINFDIKKEDFVTNKVMCSKIKAYCNKRIEELITNSLTLRQAIFNGYPLYKEPYTAWYLYSHGILEKLDFIPFKVTTGSGRSHGEYTIVLKPKKED